MEEQFKKACDRGVQSALSEIRKNFEENSDPTKNLPYHNTEHTQKVIERTVKILQTVQNTLPQEISERDLHLARLIASHHDIVHGLKEKEKNERESLSKLLSFMDLSNEATEIKLFTEKDKAIAEEAILATIAEFSSEFKTIVQPHIKNVTSLISHALLLADLGGAGMDGGKIYLQEGNALFREENKELNKEQENLKDKIIMWTKSQIDFAKGRKELLEDELIGIPQEAQDSVRDLFSTFDESIEASEKKLKERSDMSYEELLRDVGYQI